MATTKTWIVVPTTTAAGLEVQVDLDGQDKGYIVITQGDRIVVTDIETLTKLVHNINGAMP